MKLYVTANDIMDLGVKGIKICEVKKILFNMMIDGLPNMDNREGQLYELKQIIYHKTIQT